MADSFEDFLEEVKISPVAYENFGPNLQISLIEKYIDWLKVRGE